MDEDFRHQCEVRELIRWRIRDGHWGKVTAFLDDKRVEKRAQRLKVDIKDQFRKGNQGKDKEWYE